MLFLKLPETSTNATAQKAHAKLTEQHSSDAKASASDSDAALVKATDSELCCALILASHNIKPPFAKFFSSSRVAYEIQCVYEIVLLWPNAHCVREQCPIE